METTQAKEEIQFIKEMIEKTKRGTAESGAFLILWGVLGIIAILGMQILIITEQFKWIWLNWVAFMVVGMLFSRFIGARQKKKNGVKTYAEVAMGHLWLACTIGFVLVAFVFPLFPLIDFGTIPVYVALIAGIGVFVSGGIYEWKLLKWCGVLWWLGAVGMNFCPWEYRSLVFIPLLAVGYLMPGFILNAKYRKSGVGNGS